MSSDIKKEYAQVNGTKLYYEIAGPGEPIVLIHGNTLDTRMWDDQFHAFSKHYKVIRYDVRGFGKSSNPKQGEPYSNHTDLKELLNSLEIKKAHILGLSMGGAIAINYAIEYPDNIFSLIPVDSNLNGFQYSDQFSKWISEVYSTAKTKGLKHALDMFTSGDLFESIRNNKSAYEKLKPIVYSYDGWRMINDAMQVNPVPSAASRLGEISCPVLVVIGEYDIPSFQNVANKIEEDAPNAKKCIIKGVGHMSNMEDPETFNKEVLSFLFSL